MVDSAKVKIVNTGLTSIIYPIFLGLIYNRTSCRGHRTQAEGLHRVGRSRGRNLREMEVGGVLLFFFSIILHTSLLVLFYHVLRAWTNNIEDKVIHPSELGARSCRPSA